MPERHRVAVLGGGSFGTVLANIAAANGHDVVLWMRSGERAGIINASQENPDYLPGYVLRPELVAATELRESVSGADLVVVAVPSKSCREVARDLAGSIDPLALVVGHDDREAVLALAEVHDVGVGIPEVAARGRGGR